MLMAKWVTTRCIDCNGSGLISAYAHSDFLGAEECPSCNGSGIVYVSHNDRIVQYPGGKFLGYSPGLYDEVYKEKFLGKRKEDSYYKNIKNRCR